MRPLRYAEPGALFEVSCRTIRGQMRIRPTAKMIDILVGIIGRARKLNTGIRIYGLVFMGNHYHMLIGCDDADELASFMGHVNSNTTREINRHQGVRGPMWERRYSAVRVSRRVGFARMRLKYLLAHGVKERLVAKVRHWPGLSSARWMLDGEVLWGTWVDRTKLFLAGGKLPRSEYTTRYPLVVDTLPDMAEMTVAQQRAHWRETVANIEREHAEARQKDGETVTGVAAVLATDLFHEPAYFVRTACPAMLTDCAEEFSAWRQWRSDLFEAYRGLSMRFRAGEWGVEFPMGMFRPTGGFVPWSEEAGAAVAWEF